jgi:hypothetical protein
LLAGVERAYELHGRGADLRPLCRHRQRAEIVRIRLSDLEECQAAVLAELKDELSNVANLTQPRKPIQLLVRHLFGGRIGRTVQIAADARPGPTQSYWT